MPRRYACPSCQEPVNTWMRPGETARCAACAAESKVPADAEEVEAAPPERPPVDPAPVLDRRVGVGRPEVWAIAVGMALAVLATVFWIVGFAAATHMRDDTWIVFSSFSGPLLVLAGCILAGAALIARAIARVRQEPSGPRPDR